jgi:periplasmic protein TonB
MPLRCLLFTTDEAMVDPIWQVLARLGIEGEHCKNAVDAVERVTTQLFQIVITDWQDQPEAAFLLKTAKDLKASARPLTLAIVGEENRSFALQAGANSILLKPLRPEQMADTLGTACELLRSKFQASGPKDAHVSPEASAIVTSAGAAAAPAPASMVQGPEKLRAGEFLQSSGAAPSAQFDTESEVRETLEVSAAPVDPLTELEPMAAAVQDVAEAKPEPKEALSGWAALQARLTKSRPAPPKEAEAQSELLAYEETPSQATAVAPVAEKEKAPAWNETPEAETKTALSGYEPGAAEDSFGSPAARPATGPKRVKLVLVGALALASVALAVVPRTRQMLRVFYGHGLHETARWLNPPPAPLPQAVAQHDSFGQPDDEYKLPVAGNIPDATTDPSQIQVVPVIDPTAKVKGTDASGGQTQVETSGQTPTTGEQPPATAVQNAATDQSPFTASPATANQETQNQGAGAQVKDQASPGPGNAPAVAPVVTAATAPAQTASQPAPLQATAPVAQPTLEPPSLPTPVHNTAPPPHAVSAAQIAGIPSSLRSQVASTTPDSSGTKPADAAMAAIGPVNLPEGAVRELLTQPAVDPEYPAAAKASELAGSVVLQVFIGPDGAVQDAKFLQGSFIFARAAIDAVKQWRFKPYSMNGRATAVQSTITLNFKPPAA